MSRTRKRPRRVTSHQAKPRYCSGKAKCDICQSNTKYKNKRQSPVKERAKQ